MIRDNWSEYLISIYNANISQKIDLNILKFYDIDVRSIQFINFHLRGKILTNLSLNLLSIPQRINVNTFYYNTYPRSLVR